MPSYNQAQFIEETIRSVLLQGYPDLEYIIIDGGSTDGSVDIIRKYERWLAYWVSKPDRGQTQAINKGWMKATGDILAYINSDDYYLEGTIATVVEGFRDHARTGMVYGTATIIDEAGKEVGVWVARPFDLRIMLAEENIVPQPAAFFSRHALESVGYLDERWHMIMDYELCVRVGMRFPVVCMPRTLAKFRIHSGSKTQTRSESTTRELIHFGATFFAKHISLQEIRALKRATLSRIHYERSLTYIMKGRQQACKALGPLRESLLLHPLFALGRPLQTAYIVKEVLLSYLTIIRDRYGVKSR